MRKWCRYSWYGVVWLLVLAWSGCSESGPKPERYAYIWMDKVGVQTCISLNGEIVPVVFSEGSDRKALRMLQALKPNILLPNANGRGIWVEGFLHDKEAHTELKPGEPAEKVRVLTLKHWYIQTPFVEWVGQINRSRDEAAVRAPSIQRSGLSPSDFFGLSNPWDIDYSGYQREDSAP